MQIGQRLAIVERRTDGMKPAKQVEDAVGLGDEGRERLPPVATLPGVAALDERAAGAISLVGSAAEK